MNLFQILYSLLGYRNLIESEGSLKSRKTFKGFPKVKRSLYSTIEKEVRDAVNAKGDWIYLKDGIEGSQSYASSLLTMATQ